MRWRSKTPERDKIQVRSGEHHLDPEQDKNRVTPAEDGEHADRKQSRGNDEEELKCWCHDAVYLGSGRRALARWRPALAHRELSLPCKQTTVRRSLFPQNVETSTVQPCASRAADSALIVSPPSRERARRLERRSEAARHIATATRNRSSTSRRFFLL